MMNKCLIVCMVSIYNKCLRVRISLVTWPLTEFLNVPNLSLELITHEEARGGGFQSPANSRRRLTSHGCVLAVRVPPKIKIRLSDAAEWTLGPGPLEIGPCNNPHI